MKIYRFDPETGVYLGEDFTDEAPPRQDASALPHDATPVAPPQRGAGTLPVFDRSAQRWVIRTPSTLTEMRLDGRLDQDVPAEKSR